MKPDYAEIVKKLSVVDGSGQRWYPIHAETRILMKNRAGAVVWTRADTVRDLHEAQIPERRAA